MELLVNLLLVASPFLGFAIIFLVVWGMWLRPRMSGKVARQVLYVTGILFVITAATSPLVRPSVTPVKDQAEIDQLIIEAEQAPPVETLVLKDASPEVKPKTERTEKYEPTL